MNNIEFAALSEQLGQARSYFEYPGATRALAITEMLHRFEGKSGAVGDLIELSMFGRMLEEEYSRHRLKVPGWLADKMKLLASEIKAADRAQKLAKIAAGEREIEELRSREEKRKAKEEEVRRLREELGW